MAQGIVNLLETIQVHDQNRQHALVMLCDVQGLLESITQQHSVGKVGQVIVSNVVHRLLLQRRRMRPQLARLIDDHSARLVGHHRAYVLPPEGEEKGHEIEEPQRLVVPLRLNDARERNGAGVVVTY